MGASSSRVMEDVIDGGWDLIIDKGEIPPPVALEVVDPLEAPEFARARVAKTILEGAGPKGLEGVE